MGGGGFHDIAALVSVSFFPKQLELVRLLSSNYSCKLTTTLDLCSLQASYSRSVQSGQAL